MDGMLLRDKSKSLMIVYPWQSQAGPQMKILLLFYTKTYNKEYLRNDIDAGFFWILYIDNDLIDFDWL